MKVGIAGCGQIGGSIALKLSENEEFEISAFDKNYDTLKLLNFTIPKISIVASLKELLEQKLDILILAVPISECIRILREEISSPPYTLMDVCSVKKPIINIADSKKLDFVGGHPIAGNEKIGPAGWDKEMFTNRPFCICKGLNTTNKSMQLAFRILETLNAKPYEVDAAKHDELLGYTSHMTYIVSLALRLTCEPFKDLAGPGFQSTTRVSHQNPFMSLEILKYNKENILNSIEKFKNTLSNLEQTIKDENWRNFLKITRGNSDGS